MKVTRPLRSVGWLGASGYQMVIHQKARAASKAAKTRVSRLAASKRAKRSIRAKKAK